MSALSSIASQALFSSSSSKSCSPYGSAASTDARFGVIEKRIAEAVKNGDISKDVGDSLTQALQQVQASIDQAAQSDDVSTFSPKDISEMFASLKQALAAAKQPVPEPSPTGSDGIDITV